MATLPDAVRPLVLESPAEGGSNLNTWPTELDPSQDALTAAGLYVQNARNSAADKSTLISRGTGGLTFTDTNASRLLSELVSATRGQSSYHGGLLDVVHFLEDGVGDAYASGATQTASYSGALLTSTVWWTDATMTKKIFSVVYAYASGPLVATATYALYNSAGTLVRQLVDTFAYAGPTVTSVTRTWS